MEGQCPIPSPKERVIPVSLTRMPRTRRRERRSDEDALTPSTPVPVAPGAPDYGFLLGLFLLFSLGIVMVLSTKVFEGGWGEMVKLGIFVLLSIPALIFAAVLPDRFLRKVTPLALVGSTVLLALLYVPGNPLAVAANGATRWLKVAPNVTLQPSELAKLAFILFAAQFLEKRGRRMTQRDWMVYLGVLGVFGALIYKQPDLGTALCLVGIAGGMLIVAGASWRVMMPGILVGALMVGLLAWHTPHQRARLESWLDPWSEEHINEGGYQTVQSLVALAKGHLMGVGLGNSTQKLNNRLPEAETDFIFAIVGEEFGLVRAIGVVALYGLFVWRGLEIAARAPDRYSGLIATGVTSWVGVQAVLNLGVVTGTLPNTGVPLPFLSSGGTSLILLMAASGLVVGVSRRMIPAKPGDTKEPELSLAPASRRLRPTSKKGRP
jgi:cell division protein FtsW